MLAFTGNPTPLTPADFERAARAIGCPVAAIRAVSDVESRGGFLADGRPKILFERHVFRRQTGGRFDGAHPAISCAAPGGYRGGAAEYDRLAEALACDRAAALRSTSWGAFQLLGCNHAAAGFPDVETFVAAMVSGEGAQLDAFVRFVRASRLDDELVRCDWPGFARGYNGPDFARNRYDVRLAAAFTRSCAWAIPAKTSEPFRPRWVSRPMAILALPPRPPSSPPRRVPAFTAMAWSASRPGPPSCPRPASQHQIARRQADRPGQPHRKIGLAVPVKVHFHVSLRQHMLEAHLSGG